MIEFTQFEQEIHDALGFLFDPTYEPSDLLRSAFDSEAGRHTETIQSALIQEIKDLQPAPEVPPNARALRIYQLLSYRYLQQLSQEQTAELLDITPRHLRREQKAAVHVLAQRLWKQIQPLSGTRPEDTADNEPVDRVESVNASQSANWKSQVQEELASLYKSVSGTVADVTAGVEGAIGVAQTLAAGHSVQLEIESLEPDLMVTMHPSALRQVLVDAVDELVQRMTTQKISLQVRRSHDRVQFAFIAKPAPAQDVPEFTLVKGILKAHSGSVQIQRTDTALTLKIAIPSPDTATVVVIDDNADLVHFYRRYTERTRYQIVHLDEGPNLLGRIRQADPDVIVLDIMLPDTDGWELLTHLHEYPDTRSIPVIVCSVIRHEELALALGAALYLSKPVHRSEFVRALEQVLGRYTIASPIE